MLRFSRGVLGKFCFLSLLFSLVVNFTWAQSETATVSGQVVDPSGLNITGAQVKLVDIDRDTSTITRTSNSGLYTFPSVRPGRYRMEVSVAGFRVVNITGLTVNVQDHLEQNFKLVVGSVSESVTVEAGSPLVDTESATVSTVVDRNFAENLPLNGRSFQTLIQLTPGVVLTASNANDAGQFSVNGQRASANYWMVDGVSANIGVSSNGVAGNGMGGALPSFSVQGGTNSLVSVDALQEFRIQTSTFAPEFGRTPGAQISIVTRSGTNPFHGTLFDYFRNDALNANDWFADQSGLPKPAERQNDFGGTFSGPIIKDRTFFFFSYEGLRLALPEVLLTSVPDLAARQDAVPAMQPYLNAYPVPNGADDRATGVAQFNASFSNASSLDAYSLRIDHRLSDSFSMFGRYNYSPSTLNERSNQTGGQTANDITRAQIVTQTATVGATWLLTPRISNDFRFNYSRTNASSRIVQDSFGGAVPLSALPFPNPFTSGNSSFGLNIETLANPSIALGPIQINVQRQINVVDNAAIQHGHHALKFGVDFRRLTPQFVPPSYRQVAVFGDVASAENGAPTISIVQANLPATLLFRNLGAFAQDTWQLVPRLTLTYGLRWDIDFSPSTLQGPSLASVTGFDLSNLSELALAPAGTPPYSTRYGNVAPRIGLACEISQNARWLTVVRGGFGVFFDLASQEVGNNISAGSYPFGSEAFVSGGTFPLDSGVAAPPAINPASLASGVLDAFDPHLKLPHTLQWSASVEQGLGREQALSVSYIGAAGRQLIQSAFVSSPNARFGSVQLVTNAATSYYNALQFQFQRRLSHGLQALASYTWSHSIDTASAGSTYNFSNELLPGVNPNSNRGPSDFDIRNAFSAALTYDIPTLKPNMLVRSLLGGWSLQTIVQARSATPVDIFDADFFEFNGGIQADIRPDVVPGQPLYFYGAQCISLLQAAGVLASGQTCPGGEGFNPNAFVDPPTDSNTGNPARQGDLGRNALRGFGAFQWDFALHRDFPLRESLKLQFRAEMFNLLNHPNFGPPNNIFTTPPQALFGVSSEMLGQSLVGFGNLGGGAFNPLYQVGGPRSIQLALKLQF